MLKVVLRVSSMSIESVFLDHLESDSRGLKYFVLLYHSIRQILHFMMNTWILILRHLSTVIAGIVKLI